MKHQLGLSLVEIMVSITIGLLLMAGVIQIFANSKESYRTQDEMARVQENGRFAIEFLNFDVRMAGFMGCPNLYRLTPNIIATPPPANTFNLNNVVIGYEATGTNTWTPSLPAALSAVQSGADVLTIQRGSECGAYLTGNMSAENANIQVTTPNTCGLQQNEALMITDCVSADIFRASSVSNGADKITIAHANNVNTDNRLSKAYGTDAQVFKLLPITFYIAPGASGSPSLWSRIEGSAAGELVENVENMQILYGEDTDGNQTANRYVAANLADMSKVVSVRVSLLVRTGATNVALGPQQYQYNGATVTSPDGRVRRVFTTVIGLRNKTK